MPVNAKTLLQNATKKLIDIFTLTSRNFTYSHMKLSEDVDLKQVGMMRVMEGVSHVRYFITGCFCLW